MFENEFAQYCGWSFLGLVSQREQMHLYSQCEHVISPGHEVITVANTFIATVEAIALVGATPVFVDIDPLTYTMDWRRLPGSNYPHTCIIPVHMYGHPVEMQPVLDFARSHGLRVIEKTFVLQPTAQHTMGSELATLAILVVSVSTSVKTWGHMAKRASACTNDARLAENSVVRDHGSLIRYKHEFSASMRAWTKYRPPS